MSGSPKTASQASGFVSPPVDQKLQRSHPVEEHVSQAENLRRLDDLQRDFAAFIDRAKYVKRYSPFTVAWFENAFANYRRFLETAADLPPGQFALRIHALDEWIAWNTRRGIAEITMNAYWRSVRTFFLDRAVQTGAVNPFAGAKTPKARTPAPKARSAQDCAAILHVARNYPWKTSFQRELAVAVLATMLYAGLRKGEVFRLANGEVDLEAGTIRIVKGKGRYGGKDRMALMAPDLLRILRSYADARKSAGFANANFFVSAFKGRPLAEGALRDIVRKVSRASGVPFSPHVLRHSFVTQLIRSGVPLAIVRDLAGHANIETTLGYTAIVDDDRQREIRKLHFG
jgi:site-specific recombinase XerD